MIFICYCPFFSEIPLSSGLRITTLMLYRLNQLASSGLAR